MGDMGVEEEGGLYMVLAKEIWLGGECVLKRKVLNAGVCVGLRKAE